MGGRYQSNKPGTSPIAPLPSAAAGAREARSAARPRRAAGRANPRPMAAYCARVAPPLQNFGAKRHS